MILKTACIGEKSADSLCVGLGICFFSPHNLGGNVFGELFTRFDDLTALVAKLREMKV